MTTEMGEIIHKNSAQRSTWRKRMTSSQFKNNELSSMYHIHIIYIYIYIEGPFYDIYKDNFDISTKMLNHLGHIPCICLVNQ